MGRKYDLAIFDMDGTLTKCNSSWAFILNEFGKDNKEAYDAFVNGEIDEVEFMRRDIALWKEAKPDVSIKDIMKMIVTFPWSTEYRKPLPRYITTELNVQYAAAE